MSSLNMLGGFTIEALVSLKSALESVTLISEHPALIEGVRSYSKFIKRNYCTMHGDIE